MKNDNFLFAITNLLTSKILFVLASFGSGTNYVSTDSARNETTVLKNYFP